MSGKKVISINPELFKAGGASKAKTQKRRERKRKPIQKELRPNTLKKALLRKIKDHQKRKSEENKNAELINTTDPETNKSKLEMKQKSKSTSRRKKEKERDEFSDSSFNNSMNYLKQLSSKKNKEKQRLNQSKKMRKEQRRREKLQRRTTHNPKQHIPTPPQSRTIPKPTVASQPPHTPRPPPPPQTLTPSLTPSPQTTPVYIDALPELEQFSLTDPTPVSISFNSQEAIPVVRKPKNKTAKLQPNIGKEPPYGILKNGNKPLFREWKKTMKAEIEKDQKPKVNIHLGDPEENSTINIKSERERNLEKLKDKFQEDYSLHGGTKEDKSALLDELTKKANKPTKLRRSKTVKIIHKLGKRNGQVGVLIKNHKTRKNTQDEHKKLRKTPIHDVKEYLREHKLLKVGSAAPTDVLRSMYENAILSGEVNNKSDDVLVHNYMSKEE